MNTLVSDLLLSIYKHFDVLPTVFLTNNPIELEDREESIFQQHNWPWILYELVEHDVRSNIKWIVKYDRELNILSYIEYNKILVNIEAHKYNFQELMNDDQTDLIKCTKNAIVGGHIELFLKLFPVIKGAELTCAIFQSPIIRDIVVEKSIEWDLDQDMPLDSHEALKGTILADDLDYLLTMMKSDSSVVFHPITKVSKKTYKTVKHILDKFPRISNIHFLIVVIQGGSIELFKLVFSRIKFQPHEYFTLYTECLQSNRWDIIDILPTILRLPNNKPSACHQIILNACLLTLDSYHALKNGYRKTLYKLWCL